MDEDLIFLDSQMQKELLERFYDVTLALLAGRRGAKASARRLLDVYKRTLINDYKARAHSS